MRARPAAIPSAVKVLNPPQKVNLICIAALSGGSYAYSQSEIEDTWTTVYTGFKAAKYESTKTNKETKTIIHTGNWGSGTTSTV